MIKAGDEFVSNVGATLKVAGLYPHLEAVSLYIHSGLMWQAQDIKALRKFLEKLQRQLEQADLDTLD